MTPNDVSVLYFFIKCFKNSISLSGPNRFSVCPSYLFSLKQPMSGCFVLQSLDSPMGTDKGLWGQSRKSNHGPVGRRGFPHFLRIQRSISLSLPIGLYRKSVQKRRQFSSESKFCKVPNTDKNFFNNSYQLMKYFSDFLLWVNRIAHR